MSKTDILTELPKLARAERYEILERIWEMEEADLLNGGGPEADEKALLDRELDEYQKDPNAGADQKAVIERVRGRTATPL